MELNWFEKMKTEYFMLICLGEVHYTGTFKGCDRYSKRIYKKYPNHHNFVLVKIVGEVLKNEYPHK